MQLRTDKQTVTQVVTEQLRRKILSGELPAGAVLRQDAIAADYMVSRIPVREALRQLEAEGLVTFYAHRGAVVSSLTPEDLSELFEMRAEIEPNLLRAAAPHLTARDLKQAERYMLASWRLQGGDRIQPGWDFYVVLYGPASKPRHLELVHGLHNQTNRYWVVVADDPVARDGSRDRRQKMLDALREGEADKASAMLVEHFQICSKEAVGALTDSLRGRSLSRLRKAG
jgi:DNA-binding GntR family transcriptional regulator